MPHIWIEYSSNLRPQLELPKLMKTIQDAAIDDGSVFPLAGARTRGVCVDDYLIVDGHPDNAFVHVTLKVGHGRDLETRKQLGERVFAALREATAPIMATRPLGLSMQIDEADPVLNYKHNNYREHLKARAAGTQGSRP
jgi:5-oxopent-3-ene-1,2,5-tricarboxylate decarboxylase/2-hydroxyhepta-2,4-diene-1,7-dioate isomerase